MKMPEAMAPGIFLLLFLFYRGEGNWSATVEGFIFSV
jgi:hypothetical protein